jgi:hypothetical protein
MSVSVGDAIGQQDPGEFNARANPPLAVDLVRCASIVLRDTNKAAATSMFSTRRIAIRKVARLRPYPAVLRSLPCCAAGCPR